MLKDITIGQYFPGSSPVHRMDPRFKLIMTLLFIAMLFMGQHLYSICFCFCLWCICIFLCSCVCCLCGHFHICLSCEICR